MDKLIPYNEKHAQTVNNDVIKGKSENSNARCKRLSITIVKVSEIIDNLCVSDTKK